MKMIRIIALCSLCINYAYSQNLKNEHMDNYEDYEFINSSEGFTKNFVEDVGFYKHYIKDIFAKEGIILDGSIESLKDIDRMLRVGYLNGEQVDKELATSIVVYCGEVIISQVKGYWKLTSIEDTFQKNKIRYFPVVCDYNGIEYDFYGDVEDNFEKVHDSNLFIKIKNTVRNVSISTRQINRDFLPFPPLEDTL